MSESDPPCREDTSTRARDVIRRAHCHPVAVALSSDRSQERGADSNCQQSNQSDYKVRHCRQVLSKDGVGDVASGECEHTAIPLKAFTAAVATEFDAPISLKQFTRLVKGQSKRLD